MNTALTTLGNKLAERFDMGENGQEVISVLKATAFKGPATDAQLTALMIVAQQYGLNPFTKELYAFPDKNNGIVPVVGVDGWSRIINEHDQFDGIEFKLDDESCTCIIYRKDRSHPTSVTEYMGECKRGVGPWQSHPKRMLRHKAMIQCARLAFGFVGIFDKDEAERIAEIDMGHVDRTTGEVTPPSKPELPPCPDAKLDKWIKNVRDGNAPADELLPFAQGKHTLTAEQIDRVNKSVAEIKNPPIDGAFVKEMEGAEQ